MKLLVILSSSSRMRFMSHNWSATKQCRLQPQSVAEISHHSVLSGDRIRQCETFYTLYSIDNVEASDLYWCFYRG